MTLKKLKKYLKETFDEKRAYKVKDEQLIEPLAEFIYIEKQKSFWFAIVMLLVVCPIVILGLLYLIQTILYA